MAKKHKQAGDEHTPNQVQNRDIIQRLNFLYQAGAYLNALPGSQPSAEGTVSTSDLSRTYIKSMRLVGQKTTVKMDPSVKRTLCKRCDAILIPGLSGTVRVKSSSSHGHAVTYTCNTCHTSRRIPAPPTLTPTSTEPLVPTEPEPSRTNRRKKKRKPIARLPPFFARPGHVVFSGNERVVVDDLESGA